MPKKMKGAGPQFEKNANAFARKMMSSGMRFNNSTGYRETKATKRAKRF